jgi:hypothetical protein
MGRNQPTKTSQMSPLSRTYYSIDIGIGPRAPICYSNPDLAWHVCLLELPEAYFTVVLTVNKVIRFAITIKIILLG